MKNIHLGPALSTHPDKVK